MKRFFTDIGPILGLAIVLLISISVMSDATEDSTRFGEMYSVLLVVTALGLAILAILIGWNLIRLIGQVRRREAGARLTIRVVTIFVALSLAPVLVLYYFSLQTLHRGIESWFDVRVEQALSDALELSQTALGTRMREQLRLTTAIASDLSLLTDDALALPLAEALSNSGATELTIFNQRGSAIVSTHSDPTKLVPTPVDDTLLLRVSQSQTYVGLDPAADVGLHVRAMVELVDGTAGAGTRYLHALFPIDERMGNLAQSVESAYADYSELTYLREPLKFSFTLTLSLAVLLSMFAAAWTAFFSARRMVEPLRRLAEATHAVAEGDYEPRLDGASDDELGFLVVSFNDMTRRLRKARDETRRSQALEEEQRTYLEAVLARMSSGVITLDEDGAIVRANLAAAQILNLGQQPTAGVHVTALTALVAHLAPFVQAVETHLRANASDWRTQVTLLGQSGRQVLVCRGTNLPGHGDQPAGHVVVFDDLTAVIEAQRNAAWSEVARRLAHEIKNPLTPIQLSAERLRHKYLPQLGSENGALLVRLTNTIVSQVEAMKEMVNAFSAYARSPQSEPRPLDLTALVTDVTALYDSAQVRTELAADLPTVDADPGRLRQLLHNLIKNALEAGADTATDAVLVRTYRDVVHGSQAVLEVRDSGPGITEDLLGTLFDPYVTAKPRGTGLGLAIVKKIAEEHGGVINAENNSDVGATFTLRLPGIAASPQNASPSGEEQSAS
jgi:nitrogen fixation/metabolism regulation signal transduction histidine kinase